MRVDVGVGRLVAVVGLGRVDDGGVVAADHCHRKVVADGGGLAIGVGIVHAYAAAGVLGAAALVEKGRHHLAIDHSEVAVGVAQRIVGSLVLGRRAIAVILGRIGPIAGESRGGANGQKAQGEGGLRAG